MRLIATLFLFISFFTSNAQQDLELIYIAPWTWPSNNVGTTVGCSDEDHQVSIGIKNNTFSQTAFGVYIHLGYLVDGVQSLYDSIPTLGPTATWQFQFDTVQFNFTHHAKMKDGKTYNNIHAHLIRQFNL